MKRTLLTTAALLAASSPAAAHISISSGPATANKSSKITFSAGHGCEGGFDTMRVTVDIPASVTSVRALGNGDFEAPTLTKDGDVVTAVTWEKDAADIRAADDGYYELTFRARIPDAAFSQVAFVVHQFCLDAEGAEIQVDWAGEDAAHLVIVPSRLAGWNKYTLGAAIAEADVPTFLGDAQIVWKGTAAYSPNPNIMALISSTPGVTAMTGDLAAGDELWVKY
jgi:periplasmic copper chaperone A